MTNKKLNWGLLSTARINRALIPPLQVSKRNNLLAVASRSQEAADVYAKEKRIERAYGSYKALLADPDVDVIYNPLPNHLHAEWTIKAVEAGKHVLCEKPLALSLHEVDAIKVAAHKHGRIVAEAFMYRHHPQTLKVQEIIKNGSLGTLKLIRGSFSFVLSREGDVRLHPEMEVGAFGILDVIPSVTRGRLQGVNRMKYLAGRSQVRPGSMKRSWVSCVSGMMSSHRLIPVLLSHIIHSLKSLAAKGR